MPKSKPTPRNVTGKSGRTADAVVRLGELTLRFSRVDRITYHPDGQTPESDTDHTVMLGLIGCAFAAQHLPHLDVGRVAQLALVHDLVEVYAGDTPTLAILSQDAKADKQHREFLAWQRLVGEFADTLPWLVDRIAEYEARSTPEARYVKALDKLLPKITHVLNGLAAIRAQGMSDEDLLARYELQWHELREYAADFPAIFELRAELIDRVVALLSGSAPAAGL